MGFWKLPPAARRPIVVDNRRMLPRAPGAPGMFYGLDETSLRPGQITNDGDAPGLPSGISLNPSQAGGTGIDNANVNIDTGGKIRIVSGSTPTPTTVGAPDVLGALPELVVPLEVIAWELISIVCIVNTPVNGIDIPQIAFDDGPFSANRAGNVYYIMEAASGAIGAGNVNLPICFSQAPERGFTATNAHPILGTLPPNNRILGGHHVRFRLNDPVSTPVNGWTLSGFTACVREWRAPR